MAAHSDTKEARCFECPSSRDYDKEAGSRLVDAVRGDRVSVAMSLRLEEFEDDIAGRLMENCEIRLAVPALAEQRRADGQDSRAARGDKLAADEWLYGKAGFLRALLGLRRLAKRRRLAALEDALAVAATRVAAALLDDGRSELDEILRYSWHGTPYVGAAHGTGGICYLLLCAARDDAQLAAKAYPYVRATLKALAALAVDGNWPAVAGEARAPLVHFCHGAPGMVFAFFEGAKVFKDAALKTAALDGLHDVEGLAGCACFLRDLRQHPKDAELPFFEFHGL
ncbi:hypothetical protein JL720_14127 [Aureococcus anophagefferens]|nr:hypothetical protein JL720_14127 [Aureococcus anophagefferens]